MIFTPPGSPFARCVPNLENLWCCVVVRLGVSFQYFFFFPARKVPDFLYIFRRERERAPRENDFGVHSDHLCH